MSGGGQLTPSAADKPAPNGFDELIELVKHPSICWGRAAVAGSLGAVALGPRRVETGLTSPPPGWRAGNAAEVKIERATLEFCAESSL